MKSQKLSYCASSSFSSSSSSPSFCPSHSCTVEEDSTDPEEEAVVDTVVVEGSTVPVAEAVVGIAVEVEDCIVLEVEVAFRAAVRGIVYSAVVEIENIAAGAVSTVVDVVVKNVAAVEKIVAVEESAAVERSAAVVVGLMPLDQPPAGGSAVHLADSMECGKFVTCCEPMLDPKGVVLFQ